MKKIIILSVLILSFLQISAKQYKASFFGMRSDGITDNTSSLQKALDWISTNHPGDTLTLWVGRYVTGSVHMRSNVNIQLMEGAVLVSSEFPYNYSQVENISSLIICENIENFSIFGKGVIDGNAGALQKEYENQKNKNLISEKEFSLIFLKDCKNVNFQGIIMQNMLDGAVVMKKSESIDINTVTFFKSVNSKKSLNCIECYRVNVQNCFTEE